jgi:arylsulfatase A-like enzyme
MKEQMIKYWAQIDLIDENIGRILKDLEKTGQLDNTIIIFSTDHGDMLGDHGLRAKGVRFYEGLVHVPLIFYYPKKFKQNLQSKALVELTDIFPTILDAVEVKIPGNIEGKSLMLILKGKVSPDFHKKFVRSECYDCFAPGGKFKSAYATMLRTDRYKIVNYHSPSSKGELYDIKEDPKEFHNLWDAPKYEKIKMELMKQSFDATVKAMNMGPKRVARY